MLSRSIAVASAACCGALLALCCVNGCSTYGSELLSSTSPNTGGSDALGTAGGGGTAGANLVDGAAGDAGDAGEGPGLSSAGRAGGLNQGGAANSGAGGNAGKGGSAGISGIAGAPVVDPNLIDDLEDCDNGILIFNNPRRDGIWDTGHDPTVGGVQTPAQYMFKGTLLGKDAPYPADKCAAYTKGSGFTSYGAYMNVSMRSYADYAKTPVYDASGYKGLSFLAKAGSTAAKKMRVRFISADTDPRGGKCKLSTDKPTPSQDQLCYNHYFAVVTLTAAWQTIQLDFSGDFAQGGDGMTNPTIDLAGMYGLEFYFDPGTSFEVWIDDLKFVK